MFNTIFAALSHIRLTVNITYIPVFPAPCNIYNTIIKLFFPYKEKPKDYDLGPIYEIVLHMGYAVTILYQ